MTVSGAMYGAMPCIPTNRVDNATYAAFRVIRNHLRSGHDDAEAYQVTCANCQTGGTYHRMVNFEEHAHSCTVTGFLRVKRHNLVAQRKP